MRWQNPKSLAQILLSSFQLLQPFCGSVPRGVNLGSSGGAQRRSPSCRQPKIPQRPPQVGPHPCSWAPCAGTAGCSKCWLWVACVLAAPGSRVTLFVLFMRTSHGWPSHLPLSPPPAPEPDPTAPPPKLARNLIHLAGGCCLALGDGLGVGRGWTPACASATTSLLCDLGWPQPLSGPQFSHLKNEDVA